MKKKLVEGLAIGVMMFGMAGVASATIIYANTGMTNPTETISFDELGLADGTAITNQYASYGAIFSDSTQSSNHLALGNHATINFVEDQNEAGFILEESNYPAVFAFSTYHGGTLIESRQFYVDPGLYDPINPQIPWYVFSGYIFDKITIDTHCVLGNSLDNSLDIRLDNLQMGTKIDPVPEPATMLLMGTGLAGLVGARRKKKK